MDEIGIARHVAGSVRATDRGVGLVVTPNIQHVALLRTDRDFRRAYASAEIVTCDGFPVHRYARARGVPSPGRVTGRGIVSALMGAPRELASHRLFLVLSDPATADAVARWAAANGLGDRVQCDVPPFGFDKDADASGMLAEDIRRHGTTILLMGLGAPKSEIFVHRHRDLLGACWALCVGQSVKIAMGLLPDPPALVKRANLEWLWRIRLEPRRLLGRYLTSSIGFALAVADDIVKK